MPDLLDAVERLYAHEDAEKITTRHIAREANVSAGVAYRYFETKEALLGAALDRMAERISAAVSSTEGPEAAMEALWSALDANPAWPRLVTSAILNGQNLSEIMSKHPLMRDVAISAADAGVEDPQTAAGLVGLIGIAGAIYGSTINRSLQRDPEDRRLYDAAAQATANWLTEHGDKPPATDASDNPDRP